MESDVGAKLEFDLRIRQVFPRRRDLRDDLALVVAGDEIVEDVAVDVVAVGVPLNLRIERGRLVHEIHHEALLGGPGRGDASQSEDRGAGGSERIGSPGNGHDCFSFDEGIGRSAAMGGD